VVSVVGSVRLPSGELVQAVGVVPVRPTTRFGVCVYPYPVASGTPHTRQQEYDAYVAACGQPAYLRTYLNPTQSTLTGLGTVWPVPGEVSDWRTRGSVLSIKFNQPALAVGDYDAKIRALCTGYGGTFLAIANHHEPEDDIEGGAFTAAQWRAGSARLASVVNALKLPNVEPWAILMGYTWEAASGRNPEDYWVPGLAGYAVDQYNNPSARHDSTPWKSPAQLMDAFTAWARAKRVKLGWTEIGCAPDFTNPQRRADWATAAAQYCLANGYALASWFDEAGPKADWELRAVVKRSKYFAASSNVAVETVLSISPDSVAPTAWRAAIGG
jgi:hypothetical protein